jgi:hypothetical protein
MPYVHGKAIVGLVVIAFTWQIADTCPKLIEAIPSRMHDEKSRAMC